MTSSKTATIETLTAQVRVLMVGSRQVTLSVYAQLDQVSPEDVTPFGRVRTRDKDHWIAIVGVDSEGGLVGSHIQRDFFSDYFYVEAGVTKRCRTSSSHYGHAHGCRYRRVAGYFLPFSPGAVWVYDGVPAVAVDWSKLPLIVLAGLR